VGGEMTQEKAALNSKITLPRSRSLSRESICRRHQALAITSLKLRPYDASNAAAPDGCVLDQSQ
jgi:hypothetical protein